MSEGTFSRAAVRGVDEEVLRLVEAHARHVGAQLPRARLGTQFAETFMAALPAALRLGLGDLTGTASYIAGTFVRHGLLPALPNPKVSRAIPKLLAPLTPLMEARSARIWSLRLTGLHDRRSALVAKLRKSTPAGAFAVRSPPPSHRVLTTRALVDERDALADRVAALQGELAQTVSHAEACAAEREVLAGRVASLRDELAARTREREVLAAQLAEARAAVGSLTAALGVPGADLEVARSRVAELEALRERVRVAEDAVARAKEVHQRQLEEALTAVPEELEGVAKFYEEKLREAEARASASGCDADAAAKLAELQAFLRGSIRGQEQLTLFALGRGRR